MTKARLLPTAVCGGMALFACIVITLFRPSAATFPANRIQLASEQAYIPAAVRSLRPVYPYSVIAGGVYAAGELRAAVKQDSAVREHYAGFNTSQVQFVTLASNAYRYVSFRQGDQIYWTRRKLLIPKGEVLFTDGVNYARTRCGNRLSEQTNPAQFSILEPPPEVLSPPPFRLADGQRPITTGANSGRSLQDDLPLQMGQVSFPNTIPDVVTGARPTSISTNGLPSSYITPWQPFFVALNNGAPRNTNGGGGSGSPAGAPVTAPVPIPEPDEVAIVAAALCAIWYLVRPDRKINSGHMR